MKTSSRALAVPLMLLGFTAGCEPAVTSIVDTDTDTDTNTETTATTAGESATDGTDPEPDSCVSALDILVVLDNSGSMGEEQAALSSALLAMFEPLELNGVDWRLGVTTTDNGNPWCSPGEAGQLVASSCKTRLDDFSFNNGQVDVRDIACNDVCALDSVDILPTTTQSDPNPAPRPWIEGIGGAYNVADPLAALRCMLPMGINGCGFESQLESTYLALQRAGDSNEASYGFLRSEASLLVLLISDEADCSYEEGAASIFAADGAKAFWADPNANFPTSAVCWNAGVTCSGASTGYDSCVATNKDAAGSEGVDDDEAVLHPVSRYTQLLTELEQQKQASSPGASVRLALIAGAELDGSLSYADSPDSGFQDSFGIGPGCEITNPLEPGGGSFAIPPVRMRDVSAQSGGSLSSICSADFSPGLADAIAPFVEGCS